MMFVSPCTPRFGFQVVVTDPLKYRFDRMKPTADDSQDSTAQVQLSQLVEDALVLLKKARDPSGKPYPVGEDDGITVNVRLKVDETVGPNATYPEQAVYQGQMAHETYRHRYGFNMGTNGTFNSTSNRSYPLAELTSDTPMRLTTEDLQHYPYSSIAKAMDKAGQRGNYTLAHQVADGIRNQYEVFTMNKPRKKN